MTLGWLRKPALWDGGLGQSNRPKSERTNELPCSPSAWNLHYLENCYPRDAVNINPSRLLLSHSPASHSECTGQMKQLHFRAGQAAICPAKPAPRHAAVEAASGGCGIGREAKEKDQDRMPNMQVGHPLPSWQDTCLPSPTLVADQLQGPPGQV